MTAVTGSISELRQLLAPVRSKAIGLVPTMGALHAGHARLIEAARSENGTTITSIFVNPLQFERRDDLDQYPRVLDQDVAVCERLGVDVVFAPSDAEMYPTAPSCMVQVSRIGDHLCGRYRPGHFSGVATVVLKLFNIIQPHRAYFGEKDAQQLAIVRRMVADFNLPVAILEVATVREPDGLAISSRNARLTADERRLAPSLYEALCTAREAIARGARDADAVKRAASQKIPTGTKLEYLEIVDPADMHPVEHIAGPVRVAGALWIGSTRLIDNILAA